MLYRCYFLKTLCACGDSGHRETSPNMRHHRTAREGEGRTPSGHKGCLWTIKGKPFPLNLSIREILLPRAQPQCETSQNSQRRGRTDPIWTQGMPLVHQRKTVPLTSCLCEGNSPSQSPAEVGPSLLPGADLESLSSPSDRKPKVETNITQHTE